MVRNLKECPHFCNFAKIRDVPKFSLNFKYKNIFPHINSVYIITEKINSILVASLGIYFHFLIAFFHFDFLISKI